MKIKKLGIILIVNFCLMGLLIASTSSEVSAQDDTLSEIKARGYMIVGADTEYDPFESIDPDTGLPVGFDVDLAVLLAHELGVDVTYKTSAWDPIIGNLKAGQFDMILSAMTITEEREVEVDFTRWYYKSFQAWLTKTTNTIANEAGLATSGLKVGFQLGTTSHGYVNDTLTDSDPHPYESVPLAIAALGQGSVDVVLGDYAVLAKVADGDDTLVVGGTFSPEDFGIAVRNGETELKTALNTALDGLLGSDTDAPVATDAYNSIYYQNFGVNAPGYTGAVTSMALPSDVELKYDIGGSTPGFELFALFAIIIIPIVRKIKSRK